MFYCARCPNCQNILALGHNGEWDELACWGCGFRGNAPLIRIGGLGKGMTWRNPERRQDDKERVRELQTGQ